MSPSDSRTAPGAPSRSAAVRRYLPIAMVSAAVMIYEIAMTRVLSVTLWYHFAFLSLSVAMLGLGASGVFFALRRPADTTLRRSLLASAVAMPLSVAVILNARMLVPTVSGSDWLWPVLIVIALLGPMVTLGSAVVLFLLEAAGPDIGRMYGADLAGATVGALLVVPGLSLLPAPLLVAGAALLPAAALMVSGQDRRGSAGLVGLLVVASLAWGAPYVVRYNKSYSEVDVRPVYERWTPLARITVFNSPIWSRDANVPWGWGFGTRFVPRPVREMWIDQDGSAGTPIEHAASGLAGLDHLLFDVTGVGYQLFAPRTAAIIGTGGGRDVLTALLTGVAEVDAIEMNPGVVEALSGPFREFSGDIYHRTGVHAVVAEGRSYMSRTGKRYDFIQLSLVDTWAATAAGAYALSENFLYTREAFEIYWSRLSDDGVLSVSRYSSGAQQLEGARLVLLALGTLDSLGVSDPRRHLLVVEAKGIATVLVGKRSFDQHTLDRLTAIETQRGFSRAWPPSSDGADSEPGDPISEVLARGAEEYERLGLDLSVPTDDRPFFFQSAHLLSRIDPLAAAAAGFNGRSVQVLRVLVASLLILALGLFFLPFAVAGRLARPPGFWRGSGYFAAIGLGFMLIEIPWIQRSILYLGHPSYATVTVLSALLLGAGGGSFITARISLAGLQRYRWLLPVCLVVVNLSLTPLCAQTMGQPLAVRAGLSVLVFLASGFLMGCAFPAGMRRFGDESKAWFWAVNGAFSVLASAVSLAAAMVEGFSMVLVAGVVCYVMAVILIAGSPATAMAAPRAHRRARHAG